MFDTERKALTNVLNHLVDEICLNTKETQAHYLRHDITCLQEYLETTQGSETLTEGEKT
jgi:hypothetical protein